VAISMPRVAVVVAVAGFACVVLLGAVLFGADILNPRLVVFQFLASGAVASALAGAWAANSKRAVVQIGAFALIAFVVATRPDTAALVFRAFAYVLTLVASVALAWTANSRLQVGVVGRALAWAVAFALCHVAAFGALTLANGVPFNPRLAFVVMQSGGLVGLGVGLGANLVLRLMLAAAGAANPEAGG
jgi:hypothetical protein